MMNEIVFTENTNRVNVINKKRFNGVGTTARAIAVLFIGATVIPIQKENISAYEYTSPSYIKCINVELSKGNSELYINESIDLMKIENINKINNMAAFADDWNGTGGLAFSKRAITLFRDIIEVLDKQPQIAPTGRNSLLMQYELDDGSFLAFEVKEKSVEKVYIPLGDYSKAQSEIFTKNMERQIKESVNCFYGKG